MRSAPLPRKGRTLAHPVTVSGVGIHTGASATVTLNPLKSEFGILFRAINATARQGSLLLPASAESVVDTSRCTVLGRRDARISTVEHLLSACAGLGITDLAIDVDGPELPIGDGSARLWVDAMLRAGIVDTRPRGLPVKRALDEPVIVTGKNGAFIACYPAETTRITVSVTFDHPLIGTQLARFEEGRDDYSASVAPARTFGFIEEVEALRAAGLAKGGSLDNAIVIYHDHYSAPLRFDNEFARHKLLDLMGDLLLATGASLPVADIIAVRPSHSLNTQAAKAIAARWSSVAKSVVLAEGE